jgi:hypothetical protein
MDQFIQILGKYRIGDFASIIGLFATIIGFILTIINILKSKTAAEQAKDVVEKIREDMKQINCVADLSSALAILNEIKRMNLNEDLRMLPERCTTLRSNLVTLKTSYSGFSIDEKKILQDAITSFNQIENESLLILQKPSDRHNNTILNKKINKHIESIQILLVSMKDKIGRSNKNG